MIVFYSPESQGILADYNLLVDKLNTDTERAEVEEEAKELHGQNENEARDVIRISWQKIRIMHNFFY